MTITLISKEQHQQVLLIQNKYKVLTFQNNGYEYIDKTKFSDEEKKAFNTVTNILASHIKGFHRFDNFKIRSNGNIALRFQYNWTADDERGLPFIGAGYIELNELLNGFN